MAFDEKPGTNYLANVLSGRMQKENESPMVLDFGDIWEDGSLTTYTYPAHIPKGSYSVLRQLTLGAAGSRLTDTLEADGHKHTVEVPESMRSVGPGDRVLVARVNNEYIVLDIVKKS